MERCHCPQVFDPPYMTPSPRQLSNLPEAIISRFRCRDYRQTLITTIMSFLRNSTACGDLAQCLRYPPRFGTYRVPVASRAKSGIASFPESSIQFRWYSGSFESKEKNLLPNDNQLLFHLVHEKVSISVPFMSHRRKSSRS